MKKSLLCNRVTNYALTVMKISTLVYITTCCLCSMAWASTSYAQRLAEQKITVNFKNIRLDDALEKLTEGTGFKVAYSDNLINEAARVSMKISNGSLLHALQQLLEPQHLSFSEVGNVIVLKKAPAEVQKPGKTIRGTVKDTTGATLVGVTVRVKDKQGLGTSTDINGKYVLDVPDGAVLVFNYVGFRSLEIPVGKREVLDVVLHAADSRLEEVVVVGYGTQKKISLVGAQSTVKPTDLQLPIRNLSTSLGGRLAGVVSVQRSGEPGGDNADIWIRGISTFSSSLSKPLVLVDGVPRPFADVDPEDIESFSILKDASATAVYGVRGANGVILITTKSGTPGKPKFNIRYNEGITSFTQLPEFADGVTYMQMANEALTNRGSAPRYTAEEIEATRTQSDPYLYPNVNWYNELFNKWGGMRQANMNINGGSDRANYYVATSYYDEKGLYKTDELVKYDSEVRYKRYNLTTNLTLKPSNSTTIKLGIQGYLANVNYPGSNSSDIFEKAFFMTPVLNPVKYPDGRAADGTASSVQNPYALLTQTGYANQWRNQLFSNLRVTQGLDVVTKGLSATAMFSFDAYNYVSLRRTKTPTTWLATGRDADGNLIYQQTRLGSDYLTYARNNEGSRTFYNEIALNYTRSFGKHDVGGMLLYNQSDEVNTQADDLETSLPFRFRGLAGRATYAYNNRYFAEFNFGYNGSENFLPQKRYGFFPSVAVGWLLSDEDFFKGARDVVQMAKIRFSHGKVGNSNIGGRRFAYLGTVEKLGTATAPVYSFGRSPVGMTGYDIGEYAVDVTWETSKKTDLGLDLWTLHNQLNLQVDLFKEHREGIFLRRASLPAYIGMRNNPYGNVGVIDNKGIDGSMTYSGKLGQNFKFQLLGNLTYNRNTVVEDDQPDPIYPWLATKGRKVGQRFGYIALGLFESNEEIANSPKQSGDVRPGDIKFKDLNGDGVINSYDNAPIGYGQVPEIVYGFGFTLGYKAFSISTLFQGVGNMDIWLNGEGLIPFQQGLSRGNLFKNVTDRWTVDNPNPNAFYPRLGAGTINDNYTRSTWWIQNGRYLRLKTLQLTYTLPKSFISKAKLQNAQVFFSGVNLWTLSPFKMWDPELGDGSDAAYPGGARYPNIATYSLGFNLNF
ncbi:TonB-dependent receptor (plasmid) [Pedobacter sp. BS3]|uniref:TonB-dependent receptor n=1 Tax=Pedobacter sp. BS3 TaxID=2567937 RepID=UPI0011F0875F|nr:TonB-dependent receptor [Pedobacter sp. BS3]TZF86022.1 TonB-dependent receptor [Pedobacter sp. BS3]